MGAIGFFKQLLYIYIYRYIVDFYDSKIKYPKAKTLNDLANHSSKATFSSSLESNIENNILSVAEKRELNEKVVLIYLKSQKNRVEFEDTIEEEYVEKVYFFLLIRLE